MRHCTRGNTQLKKRGATVPAGIAAPYCLFEAEGRERGATARQTISSQMPFEKATGSSMGRPSINSA